MNRSSSQSLAPESPVDAAHRPQLRRWSGRRIAWIIGLILLLFLTYKVIRLGLYGLLAYSSGTELRALVQAESSTGNLPAFQEPLTELTRAVVGLEREMRVFAPLLNAAAWIPGVGPTIGAMPELMRTGRELISIASDGVSLVGPAMATQPDASMTALLAASLADADPQLAAWTQHIEAAQQALAKVPAADLHPALSDRVGKLQAILPLIGAGLSMAPELANLLGTAEPKRFLLLIQNNHELRGTGGFLTAIGLLTIADGEITGIDFLDSYDVTREDVDHAWAPEPMQKYMGIDLMFLRDANWSPDFPKTAQIAKAIYAQDAGVAVDGVISIDLRAVELLVGALSPLDVEGADAPVTGDNILEQIKLFWSRPIETGVTIDTSGREWWEQRKDFMPLLAKAALERLKDRQFNVLDVGAAVESALNERAIQVWMDNPLLADALSDAGWDGALTPDPEADFLGLVDTNMGYNKVDAVLKRSVDYQLTWPDGEDQPGLATVTVNYLHPIDMPDAVCDLTPRYDSPEYDDMARRCYFDYVRLYVPAGSELVSIEGVDPESISSERGEHNTQVLAGYFQLLPGYQHNVVFTYRLPPHITPDEYSLVIQRQAGSTPLPVTADVAGETLATEIREGRFVWDPDR